VICTASATYYIRDIFVHVLVTLAQNTATNILLDTQSVIVQ